MLDTLLDKAPGFIRSITIFSPNCLDQISNKKGGAEGPQRGGKHDGDHGRPWSGGFWSLDRVDRVLDTVVQEKESRTSSTVNAQKSIVSVQD